MVKPSFAFVLGTLTVLAASAQAQAPDPRTAAGQFALCGGASWRAAGFVEFEVRVKSAAGVVQGPYHYHWDRRNGFLRVQCPSAAGGRLDTAIDLNSRSGGAWENDKQLTGKRLADAVNGAITRFGEDVLWLTFPLDWGAAGVTLAPQPDTADNGGKPYPTVDVSSAAGSWRVMLDAETGRVARTVVNRKGAPPLNVGWSDWQAVGGVYFARTHSIAEGNESVEVTVSQVLPEAPKGAF